MMKEFYAIFAAHLAGYWNEGRKSFMGILHVKEYKTKQEALTAAEKVPKGIVFSVEKMYKNV